MVKDLYVKQMEEIIVDNSIPIPVKREAFEKIRAYLTEKREKNRRYVIESGRLKLYQKLRIPDTKIEIELSENAVGSGELNPFPFFLMKRNRIGVVTITLHNYPNAEKLLRRSQGMQRETDTDEYLLTEAIIDRWLDVEGYKWYHVEDFDVLPTP